MSILTRLLSPFDNLVLGLPVSIKRDVQEPFLDLSKVRIKKGSVRVGGTRTLRYLSLAPSEIVCESDLRPEIGFNCPKLEEEERFRYSNRRAAGL